MEKLLKEIEKRPSAFAKKATLAQLLKVLKYANEKYRNDIEVISDKAYDILESELRSREPDHPFLKQIGAPVREEIEKVKLPAYMGSLDKIKMGERQLQLWFERHSPPYFVSEKLDGVSGLIQYKSGIVKIFTRGDGTVGQDISFLGDFLRIPDIDFDICVRGEFIITKSDFEKYLSDSYPKARSAVNSVVNAKKPDEKVLSLIHFLGYEIVKRDAEKWSDQFQEMKRLGFEVTSGKSYTKLTEEKLSEIYDKMVQTGTYEIDGLVVSHDEPYRRSTKDNPKYSVAFKKNSEGITTKVLEVEWNPTKFGVLQPRVRIEMVVLDGDKVEFCSGKNANNILKNKIGPGALVEVVKSGGVIPEIIDVIKPGKETKPPFKNYHFNSTEIDFILDYPLENEQVKIKRLVHFFTQFEIPNISIGVVTRLWEANFKSPEKIFQMKISDFLTVEGVKEKMARKLRDSIHQILVQPQPLEKIMAASLCFEMGLGEKKLKLVTEAYPEILKNWKSISVDNLKEIEGFSTRSGEMFLDGMTSFEKFLKRNSYLKIREPEKEKNGSFKGLKIVFSKKRDKVLEAKIEEQGGKILNTISKKVDFLVVPDMEMESSKIKKAKELGIKIIEFSQLEAML